MITAIHELAVATDTVIAEINGRIAVQRKIVQDAERSIEFAEKYKRDAQKFYDTRFHAQATISRLQQERAPFDAVYEEHRWSRFFLVLNTNGHIHSSTSCSTCFITTDFGWLPELSGLTEADAVEAHGEILCSVCFPSAPVEWTNGTSKASKDAKAERDAAKAERLAKKRAKALVENDIDGGLLVITGEGKYDRERIRTISAAKSWLTDAASWKFNHPSYPADAVDLVARVLAVRIDSTTEAEIEAAKKRAAKRR